MLLEVVGDDLVKVINDVTEIVLENIKEVVELNVYSEDPYRGDYQRLRDNGGFLDAWSRDTTKLIGNVIKAEVGYDWGRMKYNPDEHQHGNSVEDRRENLAKYIEEGSDYDFGGNASEARPFWGVVERMFMDGSVDVMLENAMRARGIVFQRI